VEPRGPTVNILSTKKGGKDGVIKPSINLQDLRRKLYTKGKAEYFGLGRWSREWQYQRQALRPRYSPFSKVTQEDRSHKL
jgi:hypothetical protein